MLTKYTCQKRCRSTMGFMFLYSTNIHHPSWANLHRRLRKPESTTVNTSGRSNEFSTQNGATESYTTLSSWQVITTYEQAGSQRQPSRMLKSWSTSSIKYTRERSGGERAEISHKGVEEAISYACSLFILFLGLRPGTNAIGKGLNTSGSPSIGGGVFPCAGPTETSQ